MTKLKIWSKLVYLSYKCIFLWSFVCLKGKIAELWVMIIIPFLNLWEEFVQVLINILATNNKRKISKRYHKFTNTTLSLNAIISYEFAVWPIGEIRHYSCWAQFDSEIVSIWLWTDFSLMITINLWKLHRQKGLRFLIKNNQNIQYNKMANRLILLIAIEWCNNLIKISGKKE